MPIPRDKWHILDFGSGQSFDFKNVKTCPIVSPPSMHLLNSSYSAKHSSLKNSLSHSEQHHCWGKHVPKFASLSSHCNHHRCAPHCPSKATHIWAKFALGLPPNLWPMMHLLVGGFVAGQAEFIPGRGPSLPLLHFALPRLSHRCTNWQGRAKTRCR